MPTLFSLGYCAWEAKNREQGLRDVLREARITHLIDIRISPSSSSLDPKSNYGPRPWHQLPGGKGLAKLVGGLPAIEGRPPVLVWIPELGNPQKKDKAQKLLLEHLASTDPAVPAARGLGLLKGYVADERNRSCVLCACAAVETCHRTSVARTLERRYFPGTLVIQDLGPTNGQKRAPPSPGRRS